VTGRGTAAIVGLGLVGGSLARDLAVRGWRVLAADTDRGAVEAARAEGVVARGFDAAGDPAAAGLGEVTLAVVATPVRAAPSVLGWLADAAPAAVLTDVGSTKRSIVGAAEEIGEAARFVGAHPMAGDERSGWSAAREGLFAGAVTWLCPARGASQEAVGAVEALWREVGAEPRRVEAAVHDALVARTSHLPQILASALASALDGSGVARTGLGPGGRDMTRLAGSDPAVWTDILLDNADLLAPALETLLLELGQVRDRLDEADEAPLRSLLERGRRWARLP
jgi:prephenate dehydrogenase